MFEWNPTVFVNGGDLLSDRAALPPGFMVLVNSAGYDGQFYYRLARDPFTAAVEDHGVRFDAPAYRQQRILYPIMAWSLAFGDANLTPWALILLNWLALCCLAWLAGAFFFDQGGHALKGALVALYPGFQLSLARDLTEILACTLLMAALFCLARARNRMATVCMLLAVLTRETTLLLPFAALAATLVTRIVAPKRQSPVPWQFIAIPVFAVLFMQGGLYLRWGVVPVRGGQANLGLPFWWLIHQLPVLLSAPGMRLVLNIAGLGFLGLSAALGGCALCRAAQQSIRRKSGADRGVAPGATVVIVCGYALSFFLLTLLGKDFWTGVWGFMRGASEFCLLGSLIVLGAGTMRHLWLLAGATVLVQAVFLARNLFLP